jgi:hypothetical protein
MADATLKALDLAPSPAPNADVVEQLEELLRRAKFGQLRAFVLAGVHDDPGVPGCSVVIRAGKQDLGVQVVALERAKLRLLGFVEDIDLGWETSGR